MKNYLEYNINKLISYLDKTGKGFGWKNHPNRNHEGIYLEGEPFDYIIAFSNKILCFDAKLVSKGDVFYLKDKDKKQIFKLAVLEDLNKNIESFLLIYFDEHKELMKIKVKKVFTILKKRRSIKLLDCTPFDFKEEFKIE